MKQLNKNTRTASMVFSQTELGFTLVELLVGLFISLFIVAGAATFLVTSSRTLVNQSSEDLIQENARFAFEIMSSNIRLAGLSQSTNLNVDSEGIFDNAICPIDGGTSDCNNNGLMYTLNGDDIDYDSVGFDYIIDSGITCVGDTISQETKVITSFFVADLDGDNIASLYCRSFESQLNPITSNFDTFTEGDSSPLAIIDGIDSMQIQYGIDSNGNGIERYSSYNNVTDADKPNVRAIKIGLLVSSGQTVVGEQNVVSNETRIYRLFDSVNDITDTLLRQIYSTTIFLPNKS